MNLFEVSPGFTIACEHQNTRSGFRHVAILLVNNREVDRTKCCYLNRTWESYTFQSVMYKLVDRTKCMTEEQKCAARERVKHGGPNRGNPFTAVAAVASIGALLLDDQKSINDWKTRMLKAGIPGLDLPEDWDSLDEAEKQRRLDAVIKLARE